MKRALPILLLLAAMAVPGRAAEDFRFFEEKIRPVLVERCYECHSHESGKQKGGLLLDSREGLRAGGASGDAIVPGEAGLSLLLSAIRWESDDLQMPPKHQLPEKVVADFEAWIGMGAPDPREGDARPPTQVAAADHWSCQPPVKPDLPEVSAPGWARDRIDHFILAGLDRKGLKPNPDADRRTLIRRASLELTGLPPTPEEIGEFVDDTSPDTEAFARVVDRLLESDAFGARWGRHWLDVARYAESSGYDRNMTYPLAWRYRNWVIEAFNRDLPYSDFIRHQLAGDLLEAESPEEKDRQVIATAFLTIGPKTLGEGDALLFDLNTADDQIDATCRAFLALTANCARCHDHKSNTIPAKDYYALVGIFRSSKNLAAAETNNRKEHGGAWPLGKDGWEQQRRHDAHQKLIDDTQKTYLEIVKERDVIRKELEKKKVDWKTAPTPEYAAAEEKVQKHKGMVEDLKKSQPPAPTDLAMAVMDAEETVDSPLFDRGNHKSPLDAVPRGTLELFDYPAPEIEGGESGRLQLAEWIVDERNPLTARVFVNRVWHHLFGKGLVETVDNFGSTGAEPVNQALLDDLALRFRGEFDWSMKKLIRSVMLSRTYGIDSAHQEEAYTMDPDSRLNWRFPPHQLEGEVVRDSLLAISGELDPAMLEGSQVQDISLKQPKTLSREIGRRDFYVHDVTEDVNYRSVYLPHSRAAVLDVMEAFDMADPNLVVGQRQLTALPLQALYLMNSDLVLKSSQLTAAKAASHEDSLGHAWELILGRLPSDTERQAASSRGKGKPSAENLTSICQTLFCTGEFRILY